MIRIEDLIFPDFTREGDLDRVICGVEDNCCGDNLVGDIGSSDRNVSGDNDFLTSGVNADKDDAFDLEEFLLSITTAVASGDGTSGTNGIGFMSVLLLTIANGGEVTSLDNPGF